MPFGHGCCLGKSMALLELKILIATLLRNHQVIPYDFKQGIPDAFLVNGLLKCSPTFDIQLIGRYEDR